MFYRKSLSNLPLRTRRNSTSSTMSFEIIPTSSTMSFEFIPCPPSSRPRTPPPLKTQHDIADVEETPAPEKTLLDDDIADMASFEPVLEINLEADDIKGLQLLSIPTHLAIPDVNLEAIPDSHFVPIPDVNLGAIPDSYLVPVPDISLYSLPPLSSSSGTSSCSGTHTPRTSAFPANPPPKPANPEETALKEQLSTALEQLTQLEARNKIVVTERFNLEHRVRELNDEISTLQDMIEAFETERADSDRESKEFQKQLASLRDEKTTTDIQLAKIRKDMAGLREKVVEADGLRVLIGAAQKGKVTAEAKCESLEKVIEVLKKDVAALGEDVRGWEGIRKEMAELAVHGANSEKEIAAAREESRVARDSFKGQRDLVERLVREKAAAKEAHEKEHFALAEAKLNGDEAFKEQISKLGERNSQLEQDHKAAELECCLLEEKIKTLQTEAASHSQELFTQLAIKQADDKAHAHEKTLSEFREAKSREIADLRIQLSNQVGDSTSERLGLLTEAAEAAQKSGAEIARLITDNHSLDVQLSHLRTEATDLKVDNSALKLSKNLVEDQYRELKDKHASLSSTHHILKKELESHKAKYEAELHKATMIAVRQVKKAEEVLEREHLRTSAVIQEHGQAFGAHLAGMISKTIGEKVEAVATGCWANLEAEVKNSLNEQFGNLSLASGSMLRGVMDGMFDVTQEIKAASGVVKESEGALVRAIARVEEASGNVNAYLMAITSMLVVMIASGVLLLIRQE